MIDYQLDEYCSDDDPVVSEIPIYHSARLEQNLYLFQCRDDITSNFKYGNVNTLSFKPENQELKFQIGFLNTANNRPSSSHDDSDDEEAVWVESRKTVSRPECVAVAAFNGKEVHLTSIKNLFKFGIDYGQYNKDTKKIDEEESSDDEEPNLKQVTVRFKKNPPANQKQVLSSKSHAAKSASEKWVECDLIKPDSTLSQLEKIKLFAEYTYDIDQSNQLDEKTYFKLLVPEDQEQSAVGPSLPSHVISLNALKALPLLEQCRLFLKEAQIVQFQQIMMLLAGPGLTTDSLLKILPQVAVLVRGNWVVKSEVLYPPNTRSAICGVPSEKMCRARDYLLYLLTKNPIIERKKVSCIVDIPAEEIKLIFNGICSVRHSKGWQLNLSDDSDFIAKHPEIEQRQTLLWEERYNQICDFLKENRRRKSRSESRSESKSFSEDKKSGFYNSSDNDSGTEKNKSPLKKKKRTE